MPAEPTIDDFLAEVMDFLSAHAAPRGRGQHRAVDEDRITVLPERSPGEDEGELAAARQWRRLRFDAGLGWIDGPLERGGRGLSAKHTRLYADAEAGFDVPPMAVFAVTDGVVVPTILEFAEPGIKDGLLRGLKRGDLVGCQLFSEPGAGSDLSAVRTMAHLTDGGWCIEGQKVWTSGGHLADVGLLLARTGRREGHLGLTVFVIDMHASGVIVRPLRQMTGGSSFNEVFLDEVVVPEDVRLGGLDAGWDVAMGALRHERSLAGDMEWLMMGPVDRAKKLVRELGCADDALIRDELASVYCHARVAELTVARASQTSASAAASIVKLSMTSNLQRISALVGRVLGPRLVADSKQRGTYAWAEFVLAVPGLRLAGGTDEIQRNTIAERVLGLPK